MAGYVERFERVVLLKTDRAYGPQASLLGVSALWHGIWLLLTPGADLRQLWPSLQ